MQSPFEVLGVDPGADDDEIRRAYRERAKDAHPDQGGSRREFQVVRAAYEELLNGEGGEWVDAVKSRYGDRVHERRSQVEFLNYEVLVDRGWSLDDADLFEKAKAASLAPGDYGSLVVEGDESLLEAAEADDHDWPFSCRGGACANCAIAVVSGEIEHYHDHVIPPELADRGIQLSCIGTPVTSDLQVVFNVKYLPELEELRLPPRPS